VRIKVRKEPGDVLFRIKRGLAGYVSYLAACEMNDAFSEYVLYEPILRILTARGFTAHCEVECPGIPQSVKGDRKRIDFEAIRGSVRFALEVKWARYATLNVDNDYQKLVCFHASHPASGAFLCVFGRKTHIARVRLSQKAFKERGTAIYADLRRTKYGCRISELTNS
jgi:Holliday junction resolvase